MQIVIPMSGYGERFRRVGYEVPKPLIEVQGLTMIEHVIKLFPGESDFVFVCNAEHLEHPNFRMRQILQQASPKAQIVAVEPHKLGPVHAVLQAADFLDPHEPTIVNYCDFSCIWDYSDFLNFVSETDCAGAIPAYRGFHPHSLGGTKYAYLLERHGWLLDIKEKQPFTDKPMGEYASSGTYYFDSASRMLAAMTECVARDLSVGGEYYVSLAFKPILESGAHVAVYPIEYFMQWGTPEDLREFEYWANGFRSLANPVANTRGLGNVVVPMAGLGSRFADAGWSEPKPLISVSGKPMVLQSLVGRPDSDSYVFVVRRDMESADRLLEVLSSNCGRPEIAFVDGPTTGQAISASEGVSQLPESEFANACTVTAVDHGLTYDEDLLFELLERYDLLVWGFRGFPAAIRNPESYGWINEANALIGSIVVKKRPSDVKSTPVVVGAFTFRSVQVFHDCLKRMVARGGKVGGEYYLDECVNDAVALGYRCGLFEVSSFFSFGTPDELQAFNYWQAAFHTWNFHPYDLRQDAHVDPASIDALEANARISPVVRPTVHSASSDHSL